MTEKEAETTNSTVESERMMILISTVEEKVSVSPSQDFMSLHGRIKEPQRSHYFC